MPRRLMREHDLTFVHPFDDPDVIAGQGTIGMEILRQHGRPIHAIFVAIGGGGLIAGISTYVKRVRPDIKVIGVQHVESDAMARSVAAGERVELDDVGLFSDGTAVKAVGVETFRLVQQHVDDILIVDTDETCAAIKDVVHRHAHPARAGRCARHRRAQAVRRGDRHPRRDARGRRVWCEHELRSAAVRVGACGARRTPRSRLRSDRARAAGQFPTLLRAGR